MDTKQWKYRIGTGKMRVFLSLGMTALFVGISIWLHKTQNPAYLFGDILSAIMVAVLLLTVYRLLFYKVLIGRDGFYYQSHISNGLYHNYSELKNAWLTTGQNLSGHETSWCHFETADGKVTRFVYYYGDEKAVRYLVSRTEAETAGRAEEKQQYRIDGKASGMVGLVGALIAAGMLCIFDIPFLQLGGVAFFTGLIGLLVAGYIVVTALFSYFCFQVKIEEKGFYCQTNPFNGTYYAYEDITHCRSVKRIYRRRRSATRNHYFYLYFTDRYGKTRRFQYEEDIYGHEINVLKERIEKK